MLLFNCPDALFLDSICAERLVERNVCICTKVHVNNNCIVEEDLGAWTVLKVSKHWVLYCTVHKCDLA